MLTSIRPCLSGSALKLIAVVTMMIDHIGLHLLYYVPSAHETLFSFFGMHFTSFNLCRGIGRIAFPLFAFLLVEGFLHTRNRQRYTLSLLLFAVISEIPWDLVFTDSLFFPEQNVFFTLLFGLLSIWSLEKFRNEPVKACAATLSLFILSYFFRADYNYIGVAFIVLLYVFRQNLLVTSLAGTYLFLPQWTVALAFFPIALYNGKRGFIQGKWMKYSFYAFYPLHLLLLWGCKHLFLT